MAHMAHMFVCVRNKKPEAPQKVRFLTGTHFFLWVCSLNKPTVPENGAHHTPHGAFLRVSAAQPGSLPLNSILHGRRTHTPFTYGPPSDPNQIHAWQVFRPLSWGLTPCDAGLPSNPGTSVSPPESGADSLRCSLPNPGSSPRQLSPDPQPCPQALPKRETWAPC